MASSRSVPRSALQTAVAVATVTLLLAACGSSGPAAAPPTSKATVVTMAPPAHAAMDSGGDMTKDCGRGTKVSDGYTCRHDAHYMFSAYPFTKKASKKQLDASWSFARKTGTYIKATYPTIEAARAAGYDFDDRMEWLKKNADSPRADQLRSVLKHGVVTHLFKRDLLRDDKVADPHAPEALVFITDGTKYVLAGVLFMAPLGTHGPQMGGPATVWHRHPGAGCWEGSTLLGFGTGDPEQCERGATVTWTPEMLHVWFDRATLLQTFYNDVSPSWTEEILAKG